MIYYIIVQVCIFMNKSKILEVGSKKSSFAEYITLPLGVIAKSKNSTKSLQFFMLLTFGICSKQLKKYYCYFSGIVYSMNLYAI